MNGVPPFLSSSEAQDHSLVGASPDLGNCQRIPDHLPSTVRIVDAIFHCAEVVEVRPRTSLMAALDGCYTECGSITLARGMSNGSEATASPLQDDLH